MSADHQTGHRPADQDYGAPLHDVEQMFPDFYTRPNLYTFDYGTGDDVDGPSVRAILRSKGNPGARVWAYRAVPATVEGGLQPGDWVTTSKAYARLHGEGNLPEGVPFRIIARYSYADELYTDGNSVNEWGFWPREGE